MIKITLAINPFAPSKNAFDFAAYLARLANAPLTTALLENKERVLRDEQRADAPATVSAESVVKRAMQWIKDAAALREIVYKMHRNRGLPFDELVAESRFGDVLVMHPAISFSSKIEGGFTTLAKEILKRSECPVFVVSESVERIDEIIVAYDRSASSVFALKLFSYLFPMLSDTKLTVLQVHSGAPHDDPSEYFFKEWVRNHYHCYVDFMTLKGDTDQQLVDYLNGRKNAVLVMGAYKRSAGVQLRTRSYAEWVIRNTTVPVFITHR